jgi:hypothetical protein
MESALEERVVNVDRVHETFVLVEFADGKAALYPGTLLRQMLPQAKLIVRDENIDDDQQTRN